MYAKISNNEISQYPANPFMENPSVSFPTNWVGGVINGSEYKFVTNSPPPTANIGWYYQETTPKSIGGVWYQSWVPLLKTKENIKIDVTEKRYNVEVGGVSVSNNIYSTDRESQTKYVAVAVDIQQSNSETWSIIWKTKDNKFVNLNSNQMTEVINSVRDHVQSCFNKESEYYQLIDTSNNSVLESTDFSLGWPPNG